MSSPAGPHREPVRSGRCIAVRVAGGLFGLSIDEVQEVIERRPLTRVFHAPRAVAGVTSLRGEILPVLDMSVLLETSGAPGPESRIVVVRERDGARRRAGLRVDRLEGLREFSWNDLGQVPQTVTQAVRELLVGVIVARPACSLLSLSALFDSDLLASVGEPAR